MGKRLQRQQRPIRTTHVYDLLEKSVDNDTSHVLHFGGVHGRDAEEEFALSATEEHQGHDPVEQTHQIKNPYY